MLDSLIFLKLLTVFKAAQILSAHAVSSGSFALRFCKRFSISHGQLSISETLLFSFRITPLIFWNTWLP